MAIKAAAEHSVPLTHRALALLHALSPENLEAHRLAVPAQRGGKRSNMAMSMLLQRMGIRCHCARLRSSFRDPAGEESEFERETVEMALAHTIGNKAERAYRRSRALAKRRGLIEAWEAYCLGVNVMPEKAEPAAVETAADRTGLAW